MRPRPTHISADNSRGLLTIRWDDHSECEYPFITLRTACPCAECRLRQKDRHSKSLSGELEIPLHSVQVRKLERLEMIGNYALRLVWQDGHSYGIYTRDDLRELCPQGQTMKEKTLSESSVR